MEEKKKKNTKATREREIYRTCRDETEMAEKPNKARDPAHSLIVIGGQPLHERWRELRMLLFKLTPMKQA